MGLLGMIMAGGAMGARDAANQNVQAQNQLEIETAREELRQRYYDRRYQQKRSDNMEMMQSKALLDQTVYERSRSDKLQDDETNHDRNKEIERMKDARTNSSNATRLEMARIRAGGGNATGESGAVFSPRSPEGKAAQDLVDSGVANDLPHAYEIIFAKSLAGRAAGSINGLTKGIAPEAIDMSRQFLGSGTTRNANTDTIRTFNPKTGRFE